MEASIEQGTPKKSNKNTANNCIGSTVKYKIEKLSKSLIRTVKTVLTCTNEKGIIDLRFPQMQKSKFCFAFLCFPIGSLFSALNSTFVLSNH